MYWPSKNEAQIQKAFSGPQKKKENLWIQTVVTLHQIHIHYISTFYAIVLLYVLQLYFPAHSKCKFHALALSCGAPFIQGFLILSLEVSAVITASVFQCQKRPGFFMLNKPCLLSPKKTWFMRDRKGDLSRWARARQLTGLASWSVKLALEATGVLGYYTTKIILHTTCIGIVWA